MARRPDVPRASRSTARLSTETVVAAAVSLADAEGLDGLSMRRLAADLEVNPMSLYHHVRDKDALLDAMVDAVVASIPLVEPEWHAPRWTDELRALVVGARHTMLMHPWMVRLLTERAEPTPATLAYIDRVLGILRSGGCSVRLAHHALHLLGSRILGFSQDLFDDSPGTRADPATVAAQAAAWEASLPHVAELARAATHDGALGGCDDDVEFGFALDVILEGLERRRQAESRRYPRGVRPGAAKKVSERPRRS